MSITIAAETITGFWHWGGTAAILRIFSQDGQGEWRSVDGIAVPVGAPGANWYKDVVVTISGHDISIASFTLEPTEGALVGQDPNYSAYYYNSAGTIQYGAKLTNFRVGQTPSPTTWADLEILNDVGVPAVPNSAYTKAESDFRYAPATLLDNLTDNVVPKSDGAGALEDSLFSDDGTTAHIQTNRIIFSTTNTRPSMNMVATAAGVPAYFEARSGNDLSIGLFKSGGVLQRYGLLGTAVLLTDPPFGLENQLLYTGNADFASLPDKIILRAATTSLASWAATMDITAGSANWSNTLVKVNDLGLTDASKFAIMLPEQGAQIVGPSETFNIEFSSGASLSASLRADIFGYWIY